MGVSVPVLALDPAGHLALFKMDLWGKKQGLPSDYVKAIEQTRDGYVWLGTRDGLARFDGTGFALFTNEKNPELADNYVLALLEDKGGALWIGVNGGAIAYYRDGRFSRIDTGPERAFTKVSCFAEDAAGNVYAGTSAGVCQIGPSGLRRWLKTPDMPDPAVYRLLVDASGQVWGGVLGGICNFTTQTFYAIDGASKDTFTVLAQDGRGGIWTGCLSLGLGRLVEGRFSAWETAETLGKTTPFNSLLVDRSGNLWVATQRRGLWRVLGGNLESLSDRDGVSLSSISAVAEDRDGSVWFAVSGEGLARLSQSDAVPVPVYADCVYEDRWGTLWVGSGEDVFQIARGETIPRSFPGKVGGRAICLLKDSRGRLWCGGDRGLFIYEKGTWVPFPLDGDREHFVNHIGEDRRGDIWVATDNGACRVSDDGVAWFGARDGLLEKEVIQVYQQADGILWLGTIRGVYQFRDGGFESVALDGQKVVKNARCFCNDSRGDLWIGSDSGLYIVQRGGRVRRFTRMDGLPADEVGAVIEDGRGDLWVGCSRGVFHVPRQAVEDAAAGRSARLNGYLFTEEDGLKSALCCRTTYQNGCRTADGRLWFTTAKGLAVIDPKALSGPRPPPQPLLQGMDVDGTPVPPPSGPGSGGLEVPAGGNRFSIRFSAAEFDRPLKLRFRFRLEGVDANWVDASDHRAADFTNVPPGRHQFQVMAGFEGEPWGKPTTLITFTLMPFFYQTSIFWATSVAAVMLLLAGGFRWRTRQLHRRERELTGLVADRTRDLVEEQCRTARAVAEQERQRRELEAKGEMDQLVAFGRRVAGLLNPEDILRHLEEAARERWGDVPFLTGAAREGRNPSVRRFNLKPGAPWDDAALREAWSGPLPTGRLAPGETQTDPGGHVEGVRQRLVAAGLAAVVPLAAGRTHFGLLAVGLPAGQGSLSDRDIAHMEGLASQAALSLEGAWQALEAIRWQSLSEAREEWGRTGLSGRLIFAAVCNHGCDPQPTEADVAAVLADIMPDGDSGGWERIREGVEQMVLRGVLARGQGGTLRVAHEGWLLLPESRLPLEEIVRETSGRVGAYQIMERIGAGGMGEVYRGINVHDGTEAAVKILFAREAAEAESRRRVEREGRIVASIRHPNIVRLLERGEHDGRLYLAMELLRGETLARRLKRDGPPPLASGAEWAAQIASALGELHRNGVVHRDVNANNIMVEGDGRFVLLDFGLAKGAESSNLTQAHTVLGTLPYMSPEQLRGEEVDERSDWWSFGVVIHEIFTGELPWEGESTIRIAMSILDPAQRLKRKLERRAPGPLADLVADLLKPDPSERLADAEQVVARLATAAEFVSNP